MYVTPYANAGSIAKRIYAYGSVYPTPREWTNCLQKTFKNASTLGFVQKKGHRERVYNPWPVSSLLRIPSPAPVSCVSISF